MVLAWLVLLLAVSAFLAVEMADNRKLRRRLSEAERARRAALDGWLRAIEREHDAVEAYVETVCLLESASDRMADALSALADDVDRELAEVAQASARLGQALGPDVMASLTVGDLDRIVIELRSAGASIEEIEASAVFLAAALRHRRAA